MTTLTPDEFKKKYGKDSLAMFDDMNQNRGFLSRIGSSIKDSFVKGKAQIQGTGEYADSIAPVRGTQLAGTIAMAVPKAVMSGVLKDSSQEFISENIGKPIASGFKTVTDLIGSSETLQNLVRDNPSLTKVIEETAKVTGALAETASGLIATQGVAKTAMSAVNAGQKVISGVSNIKNIIPPGGGSGSGLVSNIVKKTTDTARGVRDVIKPIVEEVKTLPGKARTNLAQTRATEATIGKLKPAGQTAVRSGVELSDVKSLYNLPKNISTKLKPLVKSVQDFASGKSTANPLEMVGKPIMKAFKTAQSRASSIGAKLGKVADGLGKVTTKQTFPKVFTQLKKVSGLNGLKVNSKGILNFNETNLASALSKADRVAIQKIFTDAIKAGTGKSKHLYRQELFNILGGKKTGLAGLSGTQEQAFNAVRKGLANVLDDTNPTYKALNMEFAKAISPINKFKKLLKGAGLDDDLANMNAGIIARRLTSFSKSNPEIRQILRDLDKVIGASSKTALGAEKLQDFYNILDKYYDIAGKTSFQGQTAAGMSKALEGSGLSKAGNLVTDQFGKLLGETDIVKQKALEEILKELFD